MPFVVNVLGSKFTYSDLSSEIVALKHMAKERGMELLFMKKGPEQNLLFLRDRSQEDFHFSLQNLLEDGAEHTLNDALFTLEQRRQQEKERARRKKAMSLVNHVFVSLEDSFNAGNCKAGTLAFCSQNKIDTEKIGAIRGDELLRLRNDSFTQRAILIALRRSGLEK